MKRRAVVAAAAVLMLGGCGGGRASDTAASVNGANVSRDDYERLLDVFVANSELTGLQQDLATGSVDAEGGRRWLSLMVVNAARQGFLSDAGESITDADRQAILDQVAEGAPVLAFPGAVLNLLVDADAAAAALGRIPRPDAAALAARYDESPTGTGLMCVRHIVVETEAAAQSVLDELSAGADFAELAASESIEPAAADTGGALTGQDGGACIPLFQAAQGFDPLFVAGAVEARPGAAVGPVESSFGWHVIEARPWDEVESSAIALYEQAGGDLAFQGYLATADVEIDPRYGRWDAVTGTVVAL